MAAQFTLQEAPPKHRLTKQQAFRIQPRPVGPAPITAAPPLPKPTFSLRSRFERPLRWVVDTVAGALGGALIGTMGAAICGMVFYAIPTLAPVALAASGGTVLGGLVGNLFFFNRTS